MRHVLTLEVRLSNIPARTLYQRFGFRPVGVRPRYYSDNGEDALIMTTDPIDSPQMEARMAAMRARIEGVAAAAERARRRRGRTPERESLRVTGGRILAIETSCDETAVAVVERGRRIHADVVASQVALHAETGGIVPEVAARAHLRWMIPVLDEACRRAGADGLAGIDAIAVTEGPGLAGSLLVGITMARTLAWSTTCRWCRSTITRATCTPRGCWTPTEPERPEPELPGYRARGQRRPHVPGAHPRPSRLCPPGRHRGRCGRGGVRQGRAAAWAGLPRWPGHRGRRGPRDPPRSTLPAGVAGRHGRLQLQRPQDRGPARRGGRAGPAGRHGGARWLGAPSGRRGGAGLGVPGLRDRGARDQDRSGPPSAMGRAAS